VRYLLNDFERDGLEVYNSPQTNLGAALAALNHLEDSPMIWHLQANVCVAATQIKERGPGTAVPRQVPTPEAKVDRSVLANDVIARVPLTQWQRKVEAKTK
jgi:hypothetical protein